MSRGRGTEVKVAVRQQYGTDSERPARGVRLWASMLVRHAVLHSRSRVKEERDDR